MTYSATVENKNFDYATSEYSVSSFIVSILHRPKSYQFSSWPLLEAEKTVPRTKYADGSEVTGQEIVAACVSPDVIFHRYMSSFGCGGSGTTDIFFYLTF
jgi:hypothetical protein